MGHIREGCEVEGPRSFRLRLGPFIFRSVRRHAGQRTVDYALRASTRRAGPCAVTRTDSRNRAATRRESGASEAAKNRPSEWQDSSLGVLEGVVIAPGPALVTCELCV